jgi:hypothetical protein
MNALNLNLNLTDDQTRCCQELHGVVHGAHGAMQDLRLFLAKRKHEMCTDCALVLIDKIAECAPAMGLYDKADPWLMEHHFVSYSSSPESKDLMTKALRTIQKKIRIYRKREYWMDQLEILLRPPLNRSLFDDDGEGEENDIWWNVRGPYWRNWILSCSKVNSLALDYGEPGLPPQIDAGVPDGVMKNVIFPSLYDSVVQELKELFDGYETFVSDAVEASGDLGDYLRQINKD